MSWSSMLPADVARLFARGQGNDRLDRQLNELCYHYDKLSGVAKVEVHVSATIMAHCLSYHPTNNFEPSMGDWTAKLVCLVWWTNVVDTTIPADNSTQDEDSMDDLLTLAGQVAIAQGIYRTVSKLNRSCNANVHHRSSVDMSRFTLANLTSWCPLELRNEER